jgi:tetratricopeptide (TPR) repeat protein
MVVLPARGHAGEVPASLQASLVEDDWDEFSRKARLYISTNPNSDMSDFLQGLLQEDGRVAVETYTKMIQNRPSADATQQALLRAGQYYFARGLYIAARKYFVELLENFPGSPYADKALYFSANCLSVAKEYDQSAEQFQRLLVKYPASDFAKLAKEELKEIRPHAGARSTSAPRVLSSSGDFTLQIGSFSKANNALKLREDIKGIGLPLEIVEHESGGRTYYLVLVGSFRTEEEAREFGETFREEYAKPYRIINKK